MRSLKRISLLMVFTLLCVMFSATVGEEGIVIDSDEAADVELEIELEEEGYEGAGSQGDSIVLLEDNIFELDDLEDNPLIFETERPKETLFKTNVSGDFPIDEEGTLIRYGGFEKDVIVPDGVRKIGDRAFSGYTGLESVTLPNSLEAIGYYAFQDCTNMKSITIPKKVTIIGDGAFSGCRSLAHVVLPNALKTIGYGTFSNCTSIKSIKIPANIECISDYTFYGCCSLAQVVLPNTLKTIDYAAFGNCAGLKSIKIPASVENIGGYAFYGCGFSDIQLPDTFTELPRGLFSNCDNL